MTQMLTWKPKCGKNHGSSQTAEYTMGEEYNYEDTQRQQPLVLFFATRSGYSRGNNLTHTHSLSIYVHTRYTTTYNNNCCTAGRTSPNTGVFPTLLQRGGKGWMLEYTRKINIICTDGKTIQTKRITQWLNLYYFRLTSLQFI